MGVFKSAVLAIAAMALVIAGFWLSGWNFDERGERAVACFLMTIVVGIYVFGMAASYPGECK